MSCVITDFDNRQTASKNIFISAIPPKPASKVFKYVFSPLTFTYVVNRLRYADMNILGVGEGSQESGPSLIKIDMKKMELNLVCSRACIMG